MITMDKRQPIVVVEDDFLKAQLLVETLRIWMSGKSILVARDGDEALRMITRYDPDVILLNLNLVRPSGLELLRLMQIRETGLQVVGITTQGQADLRNAAAHLGATSFIEAPFSPAELGLEVRTTAERRAS